MRNKIDYGIDLGTTNSAIARMENGIPVIRKSDTLKDTFPSCVHFNKRQDVIVGDAAYNIMKNDSARALKTFQKGRTNTFTEFKRTMGTTHSYESSNMSRTFTSDQLSAEIIKSLKSVVTDENISSIVITVPAKFLNPQNEATIKAANLLGFKQVQLLQEPVAAATAYGLSANSKDGYWLVFDFGGGTFDAALVKSEEGILSVKDTDGDNWLGGKNLDEAIVDQIIIPSLQSNFAIASIIGDIEKKELLRNAVKFYAEEAKNQLSFKETHHILTQLGDLPFEDENGEEPELDIEITQKDLQGVLSPIFQKAIDITNDLLKRNNLKGADLGALILVGGPTYSPILRDMLKTQITENVDVSVDPMTVVAKGAALFASTISVLDEIKDETRDNTKVQLEINYEATTVELDSYVNLSILPEKTTGPIPEKLFADIIRFDGGWSSGKKLIGVKKTLFEIFLVETRSNSFDVHLFDDQENRIDCQPNQFSILQGIGGLDGMQILPYYIGIGKYFHSEEKDLFMPVSGLEKSKKVPAIGVINGLKTRKTIRTGMKQDLIRIPIYQGEYNAEATNPLLNNFINEVIITGESLPGLLPEGSDVDITIKVDRSQIMKFTAYFPLLNYSEELEIEINDVSPMEITQLGLELEKAKKLALKLNNAEIINNINELGKTFENKKGSGPGRMEVLDGLRKELLKIEGMEKGAQWPIVEQELKASFYELENILGQAQEADDDEIDLEALESHFEEYKRSIEQVIKDKDLKTAKTLTQEITGLYIELRNSITKGAIDITRIKYHDREFDSLKWKDKNKARQLINQGLQMITQGHNSSLRPLLHQIWDLRIYKDNDGETLG
jgi:molecular chaperone DnaK